MKKTLRFGEKNKNQVLSKSKIYLMKMMRKRVKYNLQ
jgi:hypothetical protein